MRNLKRALSLTLASVMLLGMMVVGTSALSFNDADDISNVTAASVLEDLGIMQGDGSGNFMPDKAVTRAQMAIIVCRILYGNKLNVSQFEGTTQYTDVGANDYYTGYINLATQLGIIGGYGDGRFGPNDTVTTAQAALMLSRALGYFKGNEIAQATDWALASIAQATKINMFGNLNLPTNAELARDNVAEMVFNTISKAVPVQYNELLGVYYNENQGIIYSLEFNYLQTLGYKNFDLVYRSNDRDMYGRPATTWGVGRYNAGNSTTSSGTITKTDNLTNEGGLLPSLVRLQEKDEIITVPNAPTYVYTDKTKEKDVYKNLGKSVCTAYANKNNDPGYEWTAFINGKEVETAADSYGKALIPGANSSDIYRFTAKGTQTEIYIDDDEQTVDVIEINYYIGQVSSVKEDKGGRYVTVKELSKGSDLDVRTFYTANYAEEDYVIYTIDYIEDDDDYIIAEMFEPEIVTGEVNRVESDKDTGDTYLRFERDSTKYPYSRFSVDSKTVQQQHMVYDLDDLNVVDHPALKTDYDLLMDPNGYVVAFREANQKPNQYLYVKDSDEELKDWVAKVLLTDVTSPKVEVKDELSDLIYNDVDGAYNWINPKTLNKDKAPDKKIDWTDYKYVDTDIKGQKDSNIDHMIWKYTVSDSGVYTLKFVNPVSNWTDIRDQDTQWRMTGASIKTGKAYVTGVRSGGTETNEFIVDAKTIFVDDVNDKVYTGYKEVPNVENAEVAYVLNKGVAKVVFILDGEIYDDGNVFFMLKDTDRETFKYDGDNYWDFENAYVNGEHQSHWNVRYNALNNGDALKAGRLYEVKKTIEDGEYITEIVEWTSAGKVLPQALLTINAVGDETFWLNQYKEEKVYKYDTEGGDNPTQIVLVEYDADDNLDNITVGRLSDMKDGLITSEKNIQKDVNEQNVQMETVAVVVKAKSSNASEKDYTTARIVYIVVRPLWYNAENKATGAWEKHYYERSMVSNDDGYSWTKLDLTGVDLTGGKTITSIKVYDKDGDLITTVVEGYITTDDKGNVFANLPKEGAKIEIITGAGQADGKLVVSGEAPSGITINGSAAQNGDKVEDGDVVKITMGGAKYIVTVGDQTIEKDADGNTWTITVSGDEGLAVNIKVDDSKDKVLLTLKGTNLGKKAGTTLWTMDGKPLTDVTLTEVPDITGSYLTAMIEKDTVVQVKNDTAFATAGNYYVNGELLTVNANKAVTVTMDEAKTLDEADFVSTAKVIAVHAGEGVTLSGVFTDGSASAAVAADKVTKDEENSVWYIAASDMKAIKAKTAATTGAGALILTTDKNKVVAADESLGAGKTGQTVVFKAGTAGNDVVLALAGTTATQADAITTDVWVYAASKVDVSDTVAAADIDAKVGETAITGAVTYVKVGEKLTLTEKATGTNNISGAIVDESAGSDVVYAKAADNKLDSSYEIAAKNVKVYGAYTVTLNDVSATITNGAAGDVDVKSGDLVKAAASGVAFKDITVAPTDTANADLEVIDITAGNRHGTAYDDDADITGDITLSVATKVEITANGGADMVLTYISDISQKPIPAATSTKGADAQTAGTKETVYVLKNTEIEVDGEDDATKAVTVTVGGDAFTLDNTNYDAATGWVKLTVGEKAIAVSQAVAS